MQCDLLTGKWHLTWAETTAQPASICKHLTGSLLRFSEVEKLKLKVLAWGVVFASLFSAKSFSVPLNLQTYKQTWRAQLVNSLDSLSMSKTSGEGEEDANLYFIKG